MLTIGDVAARAGMRVATLREWERRHGFPSPQRLASGHRRYSVEQAEQVREVLARQRAGLSLPAAIRSVRTTGPPDSSVFAAVAEASSRPAVRLSRRAMLAISRAIEDTAAASGGPTVALGSFQREQVFRGCERRWRELARGSVSCVVLADFAEARSRAGVIEVPVGDASPLHREWAVAVAGRRVRACLAGWESLDAAGHFEALWSVDPDVVAAALRRGLAVARSAAPDAMLPDATSPLLDPPPLDRDAPSQTMALMDRVIARLDRP
ncbi:MAG: DICT sensory domain-containing protein [Ilumatobacteraceae bacterium]